jgi:hypothetical protein
VWIEGLALASIWLGLTFWLGLALDYLPVLAGATEMPREARAVLLALIGSVLALILHRWIFRRTFVRLADRSLAVILERRFPGFRDSLVTAVELTGQPSHAEPFDPRMLAHTGQEALAVLPGVRLHEVFNFRPLLRSLAIAAGLFGTVVALWAFNPEAATTWANRLYLLSATTWPRHALIEIVGVELLGPEDAAEGVIQPLLIPFQNGSLKVAKGSNLRLQVRANLGAKVVPSFCVMHYDSAGGERGRVTLNRSQRGQGKYQNYSYSGKPLRGILSSLRFDVVGHDYRVRDFQIEVVDSPAVTGVELDCRFPDYLADEKLGTWLPRTVELTSATQVPRGTEITLRVQTNKPLERVDLYHPDTKETDHLTITGSGEQRQRFEYRVPPLPDNLTLAVTLYDVDRVVTERPYRIFLAAVPDEKPRVEVSLKGIGTAVTPDVLLQIQGSINDDYAVARCWFDLELTAGSTPADQPKTLHREHEFALQERGRVEAALDLRQLRSQTDGLELKPKDKLALVIKAEDKYNLGPSPNLGTGDRYQLDVVTSDQLLAVLAAREIGQRRRLEQIIEEMRQARDFLNRVTAPTVDRGAEPEDSGDNASQTSFPVSLRVPLDWPRVALLGTPSSAGPRRRVRALLGVPSSATPIAFVSEVKPTPDKAQEPPSPSVVPAERAQSLRLLRTQQSLQQTRKSAQELLGVVAAVRELREELINNRVDTEDRKKRLAELIADPLQKVAETQFPELERHLETLEKTLLADLTAKRYDVHAGTQEAAAATQQANTLLAELERVLQHMLDLETFNQLLDIVRQLIQDQEKVIEGTQNERQKSLLRDLR